MTKYTVIHNSLKKELDVKNCYLLQFDGLAAPNPGECTGGAVMYDSKGHKVFETGHYMKFGTNNQGEYMGLFIGLQAAVQSSKTKGIKIKNLLIEGDSMLVIKQVMGEWKVRDETLKIFYKEIQKLIKKFDYVGIRHVYRKDNVRADELTNETLSLKESFIRFFET
jgi:ribonuclease HI